MNMFKIFFVASVIFLTSCTHLSYCPEVPKLSLPPDPMLPVDTIHSKSTPDEVIKAWVATSMAYRGWNIAVRKQVENS